MTTKNKLKTYSDVLEHRENCPHWMKGFCLDCFGGGLEEFTKPIRDELVALEKRNKECEATAMWWARQHDKWFLEYRKQKKEVEELRGNYDALVDINKQTDAQIEALKKELEGLHKVKSEATKEQIERAIKEKVEELKHRIRVSLEITVSEANQLIDIIEEVFGLDKKVKQK